MTDSALGVTQRALGVTQRALGTMRLTIGHPLGREQSERLSHDPVFSMRGQKLAEALARVREQNVVDEGHGRRGPFDVEDHAAHGAHVVRRAHTVIDGVTLPAGMYDGPKQSGWNFASTPLSV